MTDAPFHIRPVPTPTANINVNAQRKNLKNKGGASFGTVLAEDKTDGTLYWNHDTTSSGLVCGTSEQANQSLSCQSKELLRTVMQMVKLHLNDDRGSSALIFHASSRNHLLPSPKVTTVQMAKRLSSPTIVLAPKSRKEVETRYTEIPLSTNDVFPLRLAEKDISLAHILSLCTPPSDYPSRERILTSVQYIVSRMAEPFSIQEFNQMVDGEQWDENGSAFMAIRQTVLTTLVGDEGEDIANRMKKGGPIIVDLSDPVLQSTGLDGILFDMILCLYCVVRPDSKKFLVLDQSHEYLSSPALINTLVTLFSMHADSPIKTLISTSDLTQLSPRLLGHLDYLICHDFKSPSWLSYLQQHYGCNIPIELVHNLDSRQAIIISPRSITQTHAQAQAYAEAHANGQINPLYPSDDVDDQSELWGSKPIRAEIGWEWPLTAEQQKIEQLQALVAQLSTNSRRSRKESGVPSVHMDTTMKALRNCLGLLAARRAVDLASPPISPKPITIPAGQQQQQQRQRQRPQVDTLHLEPPASGSKKEFPKIESEASFADVAEWMQRPLSPEATLTTPPGLEDLPEPHYPDQLSPTDQKKFADAISRAVAKVGGVRGVPVLSEKVAEEYRRESVHLALTLPKFPFSTWKDVTEYAQREGVLDVFAAQQKEWVVLPKGAAIAAAKDAAAAAALAKEASIAAAPAPALSQIGTPRTLDGTLDDSALSVVQSPDGWYEVRKNAGTAVRDSLKAQAIAAVYEPLINTIAGLTTSQSLRPSSPAFPGPGAPVPLNSINYELKRRYPTALRDAGFKTTLDYIRNAESQELVTVKDDGAGSLFVSLTNPMIDEADLAIRQRANTLPASIAAFSNDRSPPASVGFPRQKLGHPYPLDRFEPLKAVLRSLQKHKLYRVTLTPLSLAIENMFPGAMTRFGFSSIESYVSQARDTGLVITGSASNGKTWVSLAEPPPAVSIGSITPRPMPARQRTRSLMSTSSSPVSPSAIPPLPPMPKFRAPDFSRLLRAVRALSSPGHDRVLCSRVGMMLNKDDYKAMNVETFSQCLIAAARANLVIHGGVGGSAWVALRPPDVAGVQDVSYSLPEPRSRLVKTSPPAIAINPAVPSGSAYKLPLSEQDVEPFRPLIGIMRTFIYQKHIGEPFRTVVEKNLLKTKPDVLLSSKCKTMDDYIQRAQSYGLIAQVGFGKAARIRLLENSGLALS